MCSFFGIISEDVPHLNEVEYYQSEMFSKLRHRGPDFSAFKRVDDKILLGGFVLAINGEVPQPTTSDGAWLLWNGEIYNCPAAYHNDTEFLIDFFNEGGSSSINDLDGEYAIAFHKDNLLHLITDPFFTKPLCFYLKGQALIFSSYESAVLEVEPNAKVTHALPNSHYIFDTKNYSLISREEVYIWDFEPRYNTYDHWLESYRKSITKRCKTDKKIFLPMSSGYDSGGICSELLRQKIPFTVYSYEGAEDSDIMSRRVDLIQSNPNSSHVYIDPFTEFEADFQEFYDRVENFIAYHYDGKPYLDIYHAYSCFAQYYICRLAKKTNHKICLSGHGSDEIYSDYYSPHTMGVSVVRGNYTGWREKWPNFDMGYGRNILGMFDRAGAACGVETRYPFLDKGAVQNFLWLHDDLKNKNYKQCLYETMTMNNFPFAINQKCPLRLAKGDKKNSVFFEKLAKFYKKFNIDKPKYIS